MNLAQRINPMARKRWLRFRRQRRARYSLWALAMLYLLGLLAGVICNDRPLLLRFRGRWHVPFLRFYSDDHFTGSGLLTRPDYKRLRTHPLFTDQRGHFMIFAPVPYGPYESIDPRTLHDRETVTLTWQAVQRAGRVQVDRDLVVSRPLAAGRFSERSDARIAGERLDVLWKLPDDLVEAIRLRLDNRAAPAVTRRAVARDDPSLGADLSLASFTPRDKPPRTVRVTLRDPPPPRTEELSARFDRQGRVRRGRDAWQDLPAALRDNLREGVLTAFEGAPSDMTADIAGVPHTFAFQHNAIHWPFPPTRGHWMGIDSAGRDVLARVLHGLRISMTFGLLLVLISYLLGIVAGAVQGYCGGHTDLIGQRLIEIWSALPFLYVMILMGSIYGRGFGLLLICYGLFNWIGISYYVRAEFLRLRRQPFVEAARVLGVTHARIIRRHILPNALTPVITFFPFSLVGAIAALTALDYLGFGLPPPTPSWGQLLHQAQQFRWAWWLIFFPAFAQFLVMLLGVFVGEGAREAYDPKPVTRME